MRLYAQSLPPNPVGGTNSSSSPEFQSSTIAGSLVVLIPVIILFSILGYKRYKINRYRHRIEMLERLWKIDINRKTY